MQNPELFAVSCSHCGAPLNVPPDAATITCGHCRTQLRVHHEGGAHYTAVLKQLEARTEQLGNNLRVIDLQNELERLDREWKERRRSGGGRSTAAQAAFSMGGCLLLAGTTLLGLVMTALLSGGSPGLMLLGVVLSIGAAMFVSTVFLGTFAADPQRGAYLRRRKALVAELKKARIEARHSVM